MANVKVEIELPNLPNYLRLSGAQTDAAYIDIADISDDDIDDLVEEWREALKARADKRRTDRQLAKDGAR